jgi:hypothetical protein
MEATMRVRTVASLTLAVLAGFAAAIVLLWAVRAEAAPGTTDSTFVPIAPCRLIDTRPAPDRRGPLGKLGPRTVTVQATGLNGDCAIPTEAVGLSLNVTAVLATLPTDVRIWGAGEPPLVSSLNPTPGEVAFNAVTTPLSDSGKFNIANFQGEVDVIVDVNGYHTRSSLQDLDERLQALETAQFPQAVLDRLDALEAENAALKAKTASMSIETVDGQPTVRFSDVNVQVVDGSGDTYGVNGRGNLIVGYDENVSDLRTGSHNLVIGPEHSYTSYGGLVAGFGNAINGPHASVTGGASNIASGSLASVSGGTVNTASGTVSTVTGGQNNVAAGFATSVSGGYLHTSGGTYDWRAGTLFQDS